MISKEEYQDLEEFIIGSLPSAQEYLELEQNIIGIHYDETNWFPVTYSSNNIIYTYSPCDLCKNNVINGGSGNCNCSFIK